MKVDFFSCTSSAYERRDTILEPHAPLWFGIVRDWITPAKDSINEGGVSGSIGMDAGVLFGIAGGRDPESTHLGEEGVAAVRCVVSCSLLDTETRTQLGGRVGGGGGGGINEDRT